MVSKMPNNKKAVARAIAVQTVPTATAPTATAPTATAPTATANVLPANVQVAQPPNGQTATYGNVLTVGRKQYGGSYYNSLTAVNYSLATAFTAAVLTAVKKSAAAVTPVKLSINVPNQYGTLQRVCVLSFHGQVAQVHVRYLTANGHTTAAANGLTVYGPNMSKPVGQQGTKAHSNHVVLTAANLPAVVKLVAAHAATIAA